MNCEEKMTLQRICENNVTYILMKRIYINLRMDQSTFSLTIQGESSFQLLPTSIVVGPDQKVNFSEIFSCLMVWLYLQITNKEPNLKIFHITNYR